MTINPAKECGIPSKSSWKCLLHAAKINLCALNVMPGNNNLLSDNHLHNK